MDKFSSSVCKPHYGKGKDDVESPLRYIGTTSVTRPP